MPRLALNKLNASGDVAIQNLSFYKGLYDSLGESLESGSIDRDMAQKHAVIGTVEAILKNQDVRFSEASVSAAANDGTKVLSDCELGGHLAQETAVISHRHHIKTSAR